MTRRTVLRKAFLAPWHRLVECLVLYSAAYAQARYDVAVHSLLSMITHLHSSVTPTRDNLPEFTHRWHHDMSRGLNELLRAHRYDAPHELFDDRATHMARLLDASAQWSQLNYEACNPVAAGLVRRPGDMPMQRVDYTVWKKGYIEVERPPIYFSSRRPKVLRLEVSPPPLLFEAFGGDLDKLIYHMEKRERESTQLLRQQMNRPVVGAQALRRLHPWSEPRTMREPPGQSTRCYRIGATGVIRYEAEKHASPMTGWM